MKNSDHVPLGDFSLAPCFAVASMGWDGVRCEIRTKSLNSRILRTKETCVIKK
jgi:hypothetical protein